MNPNDSSVASAPTPGSNTSPVFRNGTPNAESAADADLLNALLRKTASVLAREASTVGDGEVRLHADEYKSLLLLAQRGIKSMQEAAL